MKTSNQPLAFRIKSLNNQIRRLLERSAMANNYADLTGMQYGFLGFLVDQKKDARVYQKDLEARFNIRRSTASEMLKTLEKKGYIERVTDTEDTRLKKIIVTDKAREVNKVARENFEKLQERLTYGISPKELEQFWAVFQKISDNAEEDSAKE